MQRSEGHEFEFSRPPLGRQFDNWVDFAARPRFSLGVGLFVLEELALRAPRCQCFGCFYGSSSRTRVFRFLGGGQCCCECVWVRVGSTCSCSVFFVVRVRQFK